MKKKLTLFTASLLIVLAVPVLYGQNTKKHPRIYFDKYYPDIGYTFFGYVDLISSPITVGEAYILVQQEKVAITNVQKGRNNFHGSEISDYGITFPFECSNCYFNSSGTASINIPEYRELVFRAHFETGQIHSGGPGKGQGIVKFSKSQRELHDELSSKKGEGSIWQKYGYVESIKIGEVIGADLGKVTSALKRFERDEKDNEKYKNLINQANNYSNSREYSKALDYYKQARNIKNTDELNNQISKVESLIEQEKQEKLAATQKEVIKPSQNDNSINSKPGETKNAANENAQKLRDAQVEQKKQQEALERKKEYDEWVNAKRDQNTAMAGAMAASSASFLYLLGDAIYGNMGYFKPENAYKNESAMHISVQYGYGFSLTPIFFNSDSETMDFSGTLVETKVTEGRQSFTLNLGFRPEVGYESKYFGGNLFGNLNAGWAMLNGQFLLSADGGLEVFAGYDRIKLYLAGKKGIKQNTSSDWFDPEEFGSGKSVVTSTQFKRGVRFSFSKYERVHLSLGLITEQFIVDGAEHRKLNPLRDDDVYFVSNPDFDSGNTGDLKKMDVNGYFLNIKKDHNFSLEVNLFLAYPFTGEVLYELSDEFKEGKVDQFFVNFKFHRSIDWFF